MIVKDFFIIFSLERATIQVVYDCNIQISHTGKLRILSERLVRSAEQHLVPLMESAAPLSPLRPQVQPQFLVQGPGCG